MSHETCFRATQDMDLQYRITSAAQKEARNSVELKDTEIAKQLRQSPSMAINWFMWPVSIDYENEYSYAIDSGNPSPGKDPGVISDGNITSAIVAHWPPEPEEIVPPV